MKFSVIIPAFNAASFIEEALRSVKEQTFSGYETIVVNDGSTDGTRAAVWDFIDRHKEMKIKLIGQENKGLGAARNTGIKQAQGEYIALLDADDIWHKDKLEKVNQALIGAPGVDVICHAETWFDRAAKRKKAVYYGPAEDCTYKKLLFQGNKLSSSASAIRREALEQAGLFSEDKAWHGVEDYDLWLRLAKVNARFLFLNDICGEYVLHGNNMTRDLVSFNSRVLAVIKHHFQELPGRSWLDAYLFKKRKAKIYREAASYFLKTGNFSLALRQLFNSFKA